MTYEEASKRYNIPVDALNLLHSKGKIGKPLRKSDEGPLYMFSRIWGDDELLVMQLENLSMPERLALIRECEEGDE